MATVQAGGKPAPYAEMHIEGADLRSPISDLGS